MKEIVLELLKPFGEYPIVGIVFTFILLITIVFLIYLIIKKFNKIKFIKNDTAVELEDGNSTQPTKSKLSVKDKNEDVPNNNVSISPPKSADTQCPKCFYNLPPKNSKFIGREKVLEQIMQSFENTDERVIQSINGIDGLSKTHTAIQYAHRNKEKYSGGIFWINAETSDTIENSFAEFAVKTIIDNENQNEYKSDEIKTLVLDLFAKRKNWLIIFDNVEDENIASYLPYGDHGHILITTQRQYIEYLPKCISIPLSVFSEEEAVDFLYRYVPRENIKNEDRAKELANRLGYLPLALDYATSYMCRTGENFVGYLRILAESGLKALEKDNKKIITKIWDISFKRLENETSKRLLCMCSYTASDNIPSEILLKGNSYSNVSNAIGELYEYSLIERDGTYIKIHRLVQEVVREKLKKEDNLAFLKDCFNIFAETFPKEEDYLKIESRELLQKIINHSVHAAENFEKEFNDKESLKRTALLLHNIGCGYYELGQYNEALVYFEKAIKIREEVSEDTVHIAKTYNARALVYINRGNADDCFLALKDYEKALKISEKIFTKDHTDIAKTFNGMGTAYFNLGKPDSALNYFQKAMEIRERTLRKDHPDVASTYNDIAGAYREKAAKKETLNRDKGILEFDTEILEYYKKALDYYQKALQIREKIFAKKNKPTADTYTGIGMVHYYKEEYDQALEFFKKALNIENEVFKEEHPLIADSYKNLARVYRKKGQYDKALEYYEKLMVNREKFLGKENTATAWAYSDMALVYKDKADYSNAITYYTMAYEILEKFIEKEDPSLMEVCENINFCKEHLKNIKNPITIS